MAKIKPIAIYLPQYHPIPENDKWWGKGFTEWTNVAKAKPIFKGHYQPHLPADLGFYDLRLEEARIEQEKMAKNYGIYGFCYYHYWFNGKRILHEPIDRKLKNPKEDLPFMLCWANENWTRTWDGLDKEVLLEQKYSFEDDLNHIRFLIPFFKDPRYIKINGRPVFAVYRSTRLPNLDQTLKLWREETLKHGIELYICRFETFGEEGDAYMNGFDAAVEFPPHNWGKYIGLKKYIFTIRDIGKSFFYRLLRLRAHFNSILKKGVVIDYLSYVQGYLTKYQKPTTYPLYHCVSPGWDNSARKKSNYLIMHDSRPEYFKYWVEESLKMNTEYGPEENLFFINAWNEWAEGNHMEPCQKRGHAFLESFKAALKSCEIK